jgi:Ca2+-binding EF-hand superfamily protein
LDAVQTEEYKKVFDYADPNHDGTLDFEKVKKFLVKIGEKAEDSGVKEWIEKNDLNND